MVKVAVVYFTQSKGNMALSAKALGEALTARGAQVDVIDGAKTREKTLTGHHFLCIGTDVRSVFKGKLPSELKGFLANAGMIGGKKAMAWVQTAPLGAPKTLLQLMKTLEAEGVMMRTSEIFKNAEEARSFGKRLKIDGLSVS